MRVFSPPIAYLVTSLLFIFAFIVLNGLLHNRSINFFSFESISASGIYFSLLSELKWIFCEVNFGIFPFLLPIFILVIPFLSL